MYLLTPKLPGDRLKSISLYPLYHSREDKDSKSLGYPPAGYFFLGN